MRLVFRCDGDGRIGGGHVMRCLTLARAARERGWDVAFVMAEGGFSDRVETEFPVTPIPAATRAPAITYGPAMRAACTMPFNLTATSAAWWTLPKNVEPEPPVERGVVAI